MRRVRANGEADRWEGARGPGTARETQSRAASAAVGRDRLDRGGGGQQCPDTRPRGWSWVRRERKLCPMIWRAVGVVLGVAFLSFHQAPCGSARAGGGEARAACPEGMVFVPGGTFTMGTTAALAHMPDESPPHRVTLSPYCIDRTEVTTAAYARCSAPGCVAPEAEVGPWCAKTARHPQHPRNCITWEQASAYCAWRGARLPTEAQWEFAARGPRNLHYPWGNEPPTPRRARYRGNIEADVFPKTVPVGSYPSGRSPFGLDDMAGNVSEWVADWEGPYSTDPQTDPVGPSSGTYRRVRGGGYESDWELRTWSRAGFRPDRMTYDLGFRCASAAE